MQLRNKKIKHFVGLGAKIFLVFALLFLAFSPNVKTPDISRAADFACYKLADKTFADPIGTECPSGYEKVSPEDAAAAQETIAAEICHTFSGCIAAVVYIFTVGLATVVAYIAAYFFNLAVFISLNGTAYALQFLTDSWGSVRDIANMGFIFLLIYIAATIILKAETGNTMKMLGRVVVIALIINFSFFFVRLTIDVGNVLAINFYNQIVSSQETTTPPAGTTGAGNGGKAANLTAPIMNALNVQSALNQQSFKAFQDNSSFGTTLITLSVLYISFGVILGLLAAMFFVAGIKFISRIVILWIVIISSPAALLCYAVPSDTARKYFNHWLCALITYSLYPAVFLFMFIIIINFTTQVTLAKDIFDTILQSQSTGIPFIAETIGTICLRLGFVMVLLYLAMQFSDIMAKMGCSVATSIAARPERWMRSGIFGTAGAAGRYTLGWAGKSLAENEDVRKRAAQGGVLGLLNSGALRGGRFLGGSSFDARGTSTLQAGFGAGIGKEARGEGGYLKSVETRADNKKKFSELLKPSKAQTEDAEHKALEALGKEDPEKLKQFAQASANLAHARKKFEDGEYNQNDLKRAHGKYRAVVKDLGINERLRKAREEAGSNNAGLYADTITTGGLSSLKNLKGIRTGFYGNWAANREAAALIRNPKGDVERLKNILQKMGPEYDKKSTLDEDDAAEAATAAGGTGNTNNPSGTRNNSNDNNPPSGGGGSGGGRGGGGNDNNPSGGEGKAWSRDLGSSGGGGTRSSADQKDLVKAIRELGATIKESAQEQKQNLREITKEQTKEQKKLSKENFKGLGEKIEGMEPTIASKVVEKTREQHELDKETEVTDHTPPTASNDNIGNDNKAA